MTSSPQKLNEFVQAALAAGHDRTAIRNALLAAGWGAEQIESGFDDWAEVDFPVPVPRPRASLSAREAFLYLVLFSTLYFFAWNLGGLLFALIERLFPDPTDNEWQIARLAASIRWSISAMVIAFPVLVFIARYIARETERHPVRRLSPIRRWLTYLTLFIAAAALIGDLTTLVYNALGGELSLRFLLKILVVGLIAGSVFSYYLWDLRQEETRS